MHADRPSKNNNLNDKSRFTVVLFYEINLKNPIEYVV